MQEMQRVSASMRAHVTAPCAVNAAQATCTRGESRQFGRPISFFLSGLLGLLHLLRYERCAAHLRDFFFLVYLVYFIYFGISAARELIS
jgi:hypothetical protein